MYLAAILLYLVALAAMAWRGRRASTGDELFVAGRTLPAHVLAFTLLSTWIGSGSLFAGAGLGYRTGFAALWQPAGAWVGIALIYFIAPRVRRIAQYTVADILELRYGPAARVLGTIATVVAYTTIAAFQFRAGGRLLQLAAGINPTAGTLITAAFCIGCTALAGMLSVAYLDVGNGSMIFAGVALAVVYLVGHAGGGGAAFASLRPEQVTFFGLMSPLDALALFLPTMFLLLGEASMYQKFFSARDERASRRAVAGWLAATMAVEVLLVSIAVFGSVVKPGLSEIESEAIVVRLALESLPALLGVLLLAGAAAIVVSTANSFLLTPSTNVMRDVYQRFINPAASNAQLVVYTRVTVIVLGLAGFIAGSFFPTILAMALWAYTMYAAGITPALLAALIWPRATRRGGVASMASGMLVTLVWEVAALYRGSYPLGLQTVYPALILSIAVLIGVSLSAEPDRSAATSNEHL